MGIHGLTSFIDNNPHLLKERQLHDCRVVIDGNNLYHFLHFHLNVGFQFGGDYDVFQKKITKIFGMFKSCNIEAFVVFDGAYTTDGKKFRTTIKRATDRMHAAKRIMYGSRGILIPCLAQQTFRQTLDRLGVQHVTCDFEADNQLAVLANQMNCPVISNDSDFYIFDLSGGFLPLDYIDFRPHQLPEEVEGGTRAFLPVQYYNVDEFIKCFKALNRSVLPLFATMLGNDYINAAAFEAFYRKKTPKFATRRYSATKRHQKIVSVLYWLEDKDTKGELVSEVLSFIKPEQQRRVEKLLTDSINGYRDLQEFESFDLKVFLEGDKLAATQKTEFAMSASGDTLPPWFVTACRCGEIPASVLNSALSHRLILPTQVEGASLLTSTETSKAIREVVYGLLLGSDVDNDEATRQSDSEPPDVITPSGDTQKEPSPGSDGEVKDTSSTDSCHEAPPTKSCKESEILEPQKSSSEAIKDNECVIEYTRHYLDLRRKMVLPKTALPVFGKIPTLEQIPRCSEKDRRAVILETLGVGAEFVSGFDLDLQLYMACVVFWARNASPPITLHHLKGVLLCALLLRVHREIKDRERSLLESCVTDAKTDDGDRSLSVPSGDAAVRDSTGTEKCNAASPGKTGSGDGGNPNNEGSSITGVCAAAEEKTLDKVRANLKKYYQDPTKIGKKNPPEQSTFHGTAGLQAVLLDATHLNAVLQRPYCVPQPASLINGAFVYTIVTELNNRTNPDRFLAEMLVKGSTLTQLLDRLCSQVVAEAGPAAFTPLSKAGSKSCKSARKKEKRKERGASSTPTQGLAMSDDGGLGDGGEGEAVFCDPSNRFAALLIE